MRLAADDLMHLVARWHQFRLCLLVQPHMRLERQNAVQRVIKTLLRDAPVQISLLHAREILVHFVKKQEHVHPCRDGSRKHVAALHATGQSYHVRRICQNHPVKSKLFAEQSLYQLR